MAKDTPRSPDRQECYACGKDVEVYYPTVREGLTRIFRKHKNAEGAHCVGSHAPENP